MNADALLDRVKRGERLSGHELHWVREALRTQTTGEDTYTLIHVLWKSGDVESRETIAAQLAADDDMVRRIALQALTDLSPSEELFERARRSLEDPSQYVRMVAATSVGTLGALLPGRAAQAARVLLEAFDRRRPERGPEWEAYYEGLLSLMSVPMHQRPAATTALRDRDIDPEVMAKAREMASR